MESDHNIVVTVPLPPPTNPTPNSFRIISSSCGVVKKPPFPELLGPAMADCYVFI